MRRAISLAWHGAGKTNPNPLVGAVLVKNGAVIGEGFHQAYGALHAEREALADCARRGNSPVGATLYVTLEPCCHTGKQPPCTQAIADAGIAHVVVGSRDPNPLVHGKGNAFLRAHGISVTEDFLRDECDALNFIFFHYITTRCPYVALKYAMTADGKIATKTGASQWITGEAARAHVHRLRNRYAAILAGIGTVLADNPLLTCRAENGTNPLRVIADSTLRIPLESAIMQTAPQVQTVIACAEATLAQAGGLHKKAAIESCGATVLAVPHSAEGAVNLYELAGALGARGIDSVLIEGGAQVHYSALEAGIVQRLYCYVAPKVFGGNAKTAVAGSGVALPDQAFSFTLEQTERFGDDILLTYVAQGGAPCSQEL